MESPVVTTFILQNTRNTWWEMSKSGARSRGLTNTVVESHDTDQASSGCTMERVEEVYTCEMTVSGTLADTLDDRNCP